MSLTPSVVATLATGVVIEDLRVLLGSLAIFNTNPPTVYLYCDRIIQAAIPSFKYPGRIVVKEALNEYVGLNRAKMESLPGRKFGTVFFDFTMEKVELMRWVLSQETNAIFCDADICFLGPLPLIPAGTTVALSPHMIRDRDEARFGRYNAGFMWFFGVEPVNRWAEACKTSRFFEQAALEELATADHFYEFPITQNFGWWRLWQGKKGPQEILASWTIKRNPMTAGIAIDGEHLGSVHTHFREKKDDATRMFNDIVIERLKIIQRAHEPARKLLALLSASS